MLSWRAMARIEQFLLEGRAVLRYWFAVDMEARKRVRRCAWMVLEREEVRTVKTSDV